MEYLTGKKLIIYGTGYVAHKFYRALEKRSMQNNIRCFVRTNETGANETFEGLPVYCFSDIYVNENDLVCLAVHESLRDEIEKEVSQVTYKYIWIYPYLYELLFGESEQTQVEIDIKLLLQGFRNDLRLGVRIVAIEQWDGINTYGFDSYIRAQMIHCSQDTAKRRLNQFMVLASEWKKAGYNKNYPISVNRNYEVIDGNHRIAMAVYTGEKLINGNIYPTDMSAVEIHGQEAMLPEDILFKNGFSKQEIKRLWTVQQSYIERYYCI